MSHWNGVVFTFQTEEMTQSCSRFLSTILGLIPCWSILSAQGDRRTSNLSSWTEAPFRTLSCSRNLCTYFIGCQLLQEVFWKVSKRLLLISLTDACWWVHVGFDRAYKALKPKCRSDCYSALTRKSLIQAVPCREVGHSQHVFWRVVLLSWPVRSRAEVTNRWASEPDAGALPEHRFSHSHSVQLESLTY